MSTTLNASTLHKLDRVEQNHLKKGKKNINSILMLLQMNKILMSL